MGVPLNEHKQERARRLCMELLILELNRLGVSQVWVESRKARQDQRDLRMLDAVRSTGLIDMTLRMDFVQPFAELMLWVPDAVAGAVGSDRRGEDAVPLSHLAETVTILPRLLG
ncbi:MAG: hypothetical protein QM714_06230 [Nocardioides sp.]|uniref:hypothetical protein n=1 Tax=Nocardioides sp. TaxID=35761 RepID=UPI0039E709D5